VVISGGLGALGVLMAQWLTAQGVPHIQLLGRSAAGMSAGISSLASASCRSAISAVQCDVSMAADAGSAVAASSIPISAVLHAGGVLADGTLSRQSLSSVRRVLAPKTGGLPQLLGGVALQPGAHHVLFSSVASLLGSPGQSNYSAANAALDAAAEACGAGGLPVSSIQWGAWAGAGMAAADASTAARVERLGMSLIDPLRGLAALSTALANNTPAVLTAVPFKWPTFIASLPAAQQRFFDQVAAPSQELVRQQPSVAQSATATALPPATADIANTVSS
jgi:hypothetical protein